MNIRPIQLGRESAIVYDFALREPALRSFPDRDFLTWEDWCALVESKTTVVRALWVQSPREAGDEVVAGFALGRTADEDGPSSPKWGCLIYAAVHEAFRRGRMFPYVGTQLVNVVLDEMKRRGVRQVYLWSHPTATRFFESLAFEGADARVYMEKRL